MADARIPIATSQRALQSAASSGPAAMRVWAVIPAYNEEARIASVVRGIAGSVAGVVVVDDGSSDGTAREAERAGSEVIRRPSNGGKGAAVRAGLAAALAHGCTHVLFIDGDGQHRPEEVPALIGAAEEGAGPVVGER